VTDPDSMSRRLAAILAADVVGYGRLMEDDETATLSRLKNRRQQILAPLLKRYSGRIVKLMGDGVLAEFGSAVNAVHCAIDLQQDMAKANVEEPDLSPILLRVGINVGDVVVEGSDLFGDGVNIAARLESIAEPGAIYVSGKVREELRGKGGPGFEDLGDVALKNIARPIRVYRLGGAGPEPTVGIATGHTGTPSLAVLPFKNLSGEPGEQHFSDGITEDILTELSRFKSLRVIARYASSESSRKNPGFQQLAAELGANYIVEGSVRKSAERLRITVQLIAATNGNRIWSEKYDIRTEEISAAQDRVVWAIVASLEERMVSVAAAAARMKPTSSWTAYDYLLQGRELCNNYREPEAVPFFEKAVYIDPSFALAHAWLALAMTVAFHANADRSLLEQAYSHAKTALSLDSNDASVHHANGMVLTWLKDYDSAGNHFNRAMALNPAEIQVRADRANLLRFSGRLTEALSQIDDVIGRNAICPPWFWAIRGEILFDLRRYADALASFGNMPVKTHRLLYLAAAHAYLGESARVRSVVDEIRARKLLLSEDDIRRIKPHADEQLLQHLFGGLRLAGVLQ
jgi:adenylate cyclase